MHLALIVREFDLDVEPHLARTLPPAPTDEDAGGVEELQSWLSR